ncbi:uncharacterized protein [Dermacentor albipictus]|uniref:uncharacterized protein n=1 Tax=Dermacentor albipictus TaxID=60249 RepID=UPI0038FC54A1
MSVWDIEVEEASSEVAHGPWYLLEKDTDGASSEDAETGKLLKDSEDDSEDEEKLDFFKRVGGGERSRSRDVESFQRSPQRGDKRSGRRHSLLELAYDVAPELLRCAFEAGYVYLLTWLVEETPSEDWALPQMLSGVEIPVVILSRAHLYVVTARLMSWSVAKLRAIEEGVASCTLFLLVLLLAVLLLSAGSAHVLLLVQGMKGLLGRLAMTAWLSTYEGCNKYLVCRPHKRDPKTCTLPTWCRVSRNSTTSDALWIDAFVYEALAMSDQGQLIQAIKEMHGESLEHFARLYAFATCAWAYALVAATWAAAKMQMTMYADVISAWRVFVRHAQRQLDVHATRTDALRTAAALRSIVYGKPTRPEPILIRVPSPPCGWLLW